MTPYGQRLVRVATVALLLLLTVAFTTAPAALHDDLRTANPGEGDTLRSVPDRLRLEFTREQSLDLASVSLFGPGGEMELGGLRNDADSTAVILVPVIGSWSAGAHTVRWRIVGRDGHPVSGEYKFEVEENAHGLSTPVVSAAADTAAAASDPGSSAHGPAQEESRFDVGSPGYVLVRWINFGGLLGVLGAVSWALLVLPLARRRDPAVDVHGARSSAATVGAWSAGLVLFAAFARLVAQARSIGGSDAGYDLSLMGSILGSTVWGAGWWLQLVAALLALGGFLWARATRGPVPWGLAAASAVVLSLTPALSGHAIGTERLTALAVIADGVHVMAAGGWMGGLLLLVIVAVPGALAPHGEGGRLAPRVEAFSITALALATVVVLTGVFSAWLHLGSLDALWNSNYGRTLGLKLLLLVPLLATGAYNWRRVRPALSRAEDGGARLRRSGTAELAIAVAVLLVTAVLVATPPPTETSNPTVSESETSTNPTELP